MRSRNLAYSLCFINNFCPKVYRLHLEITMGNSQKEVAWLHNSRVKNYNPGIVNISNVVWLPGV